MQANEILYLFSYKIYNNTNCRIENAYLGKVLYLTTNPYTKEDKEGNSKCNKKNGLNAENITSLNNFDGAIMKGALVRILVNFIYDGAYKVKCSRLHKNNEMPKLKQKLLLFINFGSFFECEID